jgi:hypothetical protein
MLRAYDNATQKRVPRHDRQQDKARASQGAGTTSSGIQRLAGSETASPSPKNRFGSPHYHNNAAGEARHRFIHREMTFKLQTPRRIMEPSNGKGENQPNRA